MKIFCDTSNLDDIKEFMHWGVCDGVTTNPLILAKAGITDMEGHMTKILQLVKDKPVSIEVTCNNYDGMLNEAKNIARWDNNNPNIVVKIPCTIDGLKATNIMRSVNDSSIKKMRVNVTAIMNKTQATLAAKSGAEFVSIFMGRVEDMGYDAIRVINDTREIFDRHKMPAQIIVGSLRQMGDVNRAISSGAHILTIPSELLRKMPTHPRTESTINEFITEYAKVKDAKRDKSHST